MVNTGLLGNLLRRLNTASSFPALVILSGKVRPRDSTIVNQPVAAERGGDVLPSPRR